MISSMAITIDSAKASFEIAIADSGRRVIELAGRKL